MRCRDWHRVMGLRVALCSGEVPGSSLWHGRSPSAPAAPRQPGRTNLLLTPHTAAGWVSPVYAGSMLVFNPVIGSFSKDLSVKIKS